MWQNGLPESACAVLVSTLASVWDPLESHRSLCLSEHGPNHIWRKALIPSAWDERFALSAEYGLGHVPTLS
jgi:hypothetical protein